MVEASRSVTDYSSSIQTILYHGQPEHNERTHTHTAVYCNHQKSSKTMIILARLSGVGVNVRQKISIYKI